MWIVQHDVLCFSHRQITYQTVQNQLFQISYSGWIRLQPASWLRGYLTLHNIRARWSGQGLPFFPPSTSLCFLMKRIWVRVYRIGAGLRPRSTLSHYLSLSPIFPSLPLYLYLSLTYAYDSSLRSLIQLQDPHRTFQQTRSAAADFTKIK